MSAVIDPVYHASDARLKDYLTYLRDCRQNQALAAAGLAIGSSSTAKIKIVNTVTYISSLIAKSKTTAEVAFTATTHDIAANASSVQEACYVMSLDAAGTATITMGAVATGSGAALVPDRSSRPGTTTTNTYPATNTPIGYVRIAVAAGSTIFDASSDALSAGHLTVTYYDWLGSIDTGFAAAM